MTGVLSDSNDLFDFFHDRVRIAGAELHVEFHNDTLLYLTQLLSERARVDSRLSDDQTLAELHGAAAHASPGRRASTYRELGDHSLYHLGFFREHLDRVRRPIGPSYYADMGAAAYHQCDRVLKRWFADAFGPVFTELARHFEACVALLQAVRFHSAPNAEDLSLAYERWLLSTGSIANDEPGSEGIILVGLPDVP